MGNPSLGIDMKDEDSVVAFVLPEDLPWPVSKHADKQSIDFNKNILIKRNDPINNTRLSMTLKS